MKIQSFTVHGFRNLVQPVTFGPLQTVNVLHGGNNVGKSNVLQAMEIFFRLLGTGNQVGKDQIVGLDNGEETIGAPFKELFHLVNPTPIEWRVEASIDTEELEELSIEPEYRTDAVTIAAELKPGLAGTAQFRIQQFLVGDLDIAKLDQEKDAGVAFGQALRGLMAGTMALDASKRGSPFVRLDPRRSASETGIALVPQAIRDALFDARQAVDREQRRRWSLFDRLTEELEPELGAGSFDTAFDRRTGHANLVFDTGEVAYPIDWLGRGVQQMVSLLAALALTQAQLAALEEPELYLSLSMQGRLARILETVRESGCGPRQFFVCSQSRALDAGENSFVLALGAKGPQIAQRAWEEAPAIPASRAPSRKAGAPAARTGAATDGDLDSLIGLVDELAELDPKAIVAQGPGEENDARSPAAAGSGARPNGGNPGAGGQPARPWQSGSDRSGQK